MTILQRPLLRPASTFSSVHGITPMLYALALVACGGGTSSNPCADGGVGEGCAERAPDAGTPPDAALRDAASPDAPPDADIRECPGSCAAQGRYCDTRRGECVECLENTHCPNHKALCQTGTCVECPLPESCGTSCCDPEAWVRQAYGWACVEHTRVWSPLDPPYSPYYSRTEAKVCDPRSPVRPGAMRNGLIRGLRNGRVQVSTGRSAGILAGVQKAGQPCGSRVECASSRCEQPLSCSEGVCAGQPIATGCPEEPCAPGLVCFDHQCRDFAGRGESCEGRICAPDLYYCNPVGQLCSLLPTDGEPCVQTSECASEHQCVNGTCRAWGTAGAVCGPGTARCRRGLRCHNQTCLTLGYPGDDCGPDVLCVHGTICRSPLGQAGAPKRCFGGPYRGQRCDEHSICVEGGCIAGTCTLAFNDDQRLPYPCGIGGYERNGSCEYYADLGDKCGREGDPWCNEFAGALCGDSLTCVSDCAERP